MDFGRNLRGFCDFFLFERKREGYKRFADCIVASGTPAHHCSNDDPEVTLIYFTTMSNLVN